MVIALIRFALVAPVGDAGTEPTPPIGLAYLAAMCKKANVELNGIMEVRTSSIAECRDTAKPNFTSSSAIFLMILGTPEVDTTIRLGDIPNPSGEVILSMALRTLL